MIIIFVGATVAALGPVVAPVIRSMTSKLVSTAERGIKNPSYINN